MMRSARMPDRGTGVVSTSIPAPCDASIVVRSPAHRGVIQVLRSFYEHLVFYGLLAIFAVSSLFASLIAVILALFLPRGIRRPIGQFLIMAGFRYFLWLMQRAGILKCDLVVLDRLRDHAPLIIAPNHPSLLDVMLVVSRLPRVVCTVKARLLKNPFLGASAQLAGYIRNDTSTRLVREGIRQLREGRQLLIFPEGTRTRGGGVNSFKAGFALMAKHAAVPIQTIFIESNSPFLGKGWSLLRKPELPVVYSVRLGPIVSVDGDFRPFVTELQRLYRRELGGNDP